MRLDLCLVLLTSLLAYAPSLGWAQAQSGSDARAAIRSVIEQTQSANNAGNVEKWVSLFAQDAVYMPPSVPAVTTRKGLVEIAEAGFRHDSSITIEPLEIKVFGDWAFARTQVSGSVTVAGSGEVHTIDTKQVVLYRQTRDGEWRIARMISNSNSP